jgi:hypothetical protein
MGDAGAAGVIGVAAAMTSSKDGSAGVCAAVVVPLPAARSASIRARRVRWTTGVAASTEPSVGADDRGECGMRSVAILIGEGLARW